MYIYMYVQQVLYSRCCKGPSASKIAGATYSTLAGAFDFSSAGVMLLYCWSKCNVNVRWLAAV